MSETPRLRLPELAAAQSQKHVTHNEALVMLDCLVDLHLQDRHLAAPPSGLDGEAYLVAASPSGAWSGQAYKIAYRIDDGWRFYEPFTGLKAYVVDENTLIVFNGSDWVDFADILGLQNVTQLGINTTADPTNRLAMKSEAVLMAAIEESAGGTGDIRLNVNKDASSNTAALLFQSNYSGRAELGLAGSNNLTLKVSANGTDWLTAFSVDKASGQVGFPQGADGLPVGSIIWHAAATPPPGFLVCDGSAKSRHDFSNLFAVIGTIYGNGNGATTFNVPDLRGEFVRGWDDGRGVDVGRSLGASQSDVFKSHTHSGATSIDGSHSHSTGDDVHDKFVVVDKAVSSQAIGESGSGATAFAQGSLDLDNRGSIEVVGDHAHSFTTSATGDGETRPRNVALLACIKH
ncbi:MAG: DUF2793 domain-containing protein [Pseudomonadota bacterium]